MAGALYKIKTLFGVIHHTDCKPTVAAQLQYTVEVLELLSKSFFSWMGICSSQLNGVLFAPCFPISFQSCLLSLIKWLINNLVVSYTKMRLLDKHV
jgi:hypothetical protein